MMLAASCGLCSADGGRRPDQPAADGV